MASEEWDWSQHVVDYIDLHVSDCGASVRFYATLELYGWVSASV